MQGRVKSYFADRGFGFLVPDADGFHSDVFFHFKDLPPDVDVERGTILDFEIKTQPDGRVRATNITLS